MFAEDISLLNGMTTETVIILLEAGVIMIIGITISAFYCWEITAISVACSPLMFVGYWAMVKINDARSQGNDANAYAKANALLSEIVLNYKTVAAFG